MDEFENDDSLDLGGNGGSDDGGGGNSGTSDFTIPEEYAEKGWAKNFEGKTGDDLRSEIFKSYDNAQSLAGKKASELLTTTNLKELENFEDIKKALLPQLAPNINVPENVEDYNLNEILKDEEGNQLFEFPKEVTDTFSAQFKELGLNVEQGQGLIKMYADFETSEFQKLTDTKALDESLDTMFNGSSQTKDKCSSLLKEFLSEDQQKFLQDTAPNKFIEVLYSVAKGFSDKYDFKENPAAGQRGSNIHMSQAEKDQQYDKLYNQLMELDKRPHTDDEKQKIIKEMVALNK